MSMSLESVFSKKLNLYNELEITVDQDPEQISSSLIKKQYRKLALLYHPDKRPDDPNAMHKFHVLSLATHVLTDESLRAIYDKWFQRVLLDRSKIDEKRSGLIKKLSKLESQALKAEDSSQLRNLSEIQEYGIMLRKMKYFKIPYGDWKTQSFTAKDPGHDVDNHKLYDSSTLRLELRNNMIGSNISDKVSLRQILTDLFQVTKIHDLYYSSRNDYENDQTIVAYAVFETTAESKQIYQNWQESSGTFYGRLVLDISPRIPTTYYQNYNQRVELDPHISTLVKDSTIVID